MIANDSAEDVHTLPLSRYCIKSALQTEVKVVTKTLSCAEVKEVFLHTGIISTILLL